MKTFVQHNRLRANDRRDDSPASAVAGRLQPAVYIPCPGCCGRGTVPRPDGVDLRDCRACGGRGWTSGAAPRVLVSHLAESHDLVEFIARLELAADEALLVEGEAMESGDQFRLGLATGERVSLLSAAAALKVLLAAQQDVETVHIKRVDFVTVSGAGPDPA